MNKGNVVAMSRQKFMDDVNPLMIHYEVHKFKRIVENNFKILVPWGWFKLIVQDLFNIDDGLFRYSLKTNELFYRNVKVVRAEVERIEFVEILRD
jgi:hypothetical protein